MFFKIKFSYTELRGFIGKDGSIYWFVKELERLFEAQGKKFYCCQWRRLGNVVPTLPYIKFPWLKFLVVEHSVALKTARLPDVIGLGVDEFLALDRVEILNRRLWMQVLENPLMTITSARYVPCFHLGGKQRFRDVMAQLAHSTLLMNRDFLHMSLENPISIIHAVPLDLVPSEPLDLEPGTTLPKDLEPDRVLSPIDEFESDVLTNPELGNVFPFDLHLGFGRVTALNCNGTRNLDWLYCSDREESENDLVMDCD